MQDDGSRRAVRRGTVRRVADFARPHARTIALFLGLATIAAVLGVAAPLLAGEAVDAIVEEEETRTVVLLAVLIGVVATVEAGVGLVDSLPASRLGTTVLLHLPLASLDHVPPIPITFFTRHTHTPPP